MHGVGSNLWAFWRGFNRGSEVVRRGISLANNHTPNKAQNKRAPKPGPHTRSRTAPLGLLCCAFGWVLGLLLLVRIMCAEKCAYKVGSSGAVCGYLGGGSLGHVGRCAGVRVFSRGCSRVVGCGCVQARLFARTRGPCSNIYVQTSFPMLTQR